MKMGLIALIVASALAVAAAGPTPATSGASCTPASGFIGTICTPTAHGKHPAIVLLGGSEGGDRMKRVAPRFTKYGFVAASVAYFREPGLPQSLENVPVEAVGEAIDVIAKRPDVDRNRIAVMGASKGGELALLVASLYPEIHAVVADVPSPFAWQAIQSRPNDRPASSWTYQGKPLPYVRFTDAMAQQFQNAYLHHTPIDLRVGYDDAMQRNAAQIPPAMFHLENIRGPVLIFAADGDRLWDSPAQAQLAMAYLKAHHHPYADEYLHYPNAGHDFLFGTQTQLALGTFTMLLGGTVEGNLAAQTQAWTSIATFLSKIR